MRISAFAGIAILLFLPAAGAQTPVNNGWMLYAPANLFEIGTGPAPGADGRQAVYIRSTESSTRLRLDGASLVRMMPAIALRGQRVRLSLLVKDDGTMRSFVHVSLFNTDTNANLLGVEADSSNAKYGKDWTVHQFVVDVPVTARNFEIRVSAARTSDDTGTTWVDGPILVPVAKDVPLTGFHSIINTSKWPATQPQSY